MSKITKNPDSLRGDAEALPDEMETLLHSSVADG